MASLLFDAREFCGWLECHSINSLFRQLHGVKADIGDLVALALQDGSNLNYDRHRRKTDRCGLAREHRQGYEIQSALLLSDRDDADDAGSIRLRRVNLRRPAANLLTPLMVPQQGRKKPMAGRRRQHAGRVRSPNPTASFRLSACLKNQKEPMFMRVGGA
jgi:hypothetical protein